MRMRVLFVVLLVAAAAHAQTLRLEHYEATLADGVHSALCVVPSIGETKGRARYVCYYATPDGNKQRDDTDGSGTLRKPTAADTGFATWLNPALPAGGKCNLGALAAAGSFPDEKTLQATCPGAVYLNHPLTTVNADNFIAGVRAAVTGVGTPAMTTTVASPPLTPVKPAAPPAQTPVNVLITNPTDWMARGLLLSMSLLLSALGVDRLLQIARQRKLLKSELAGDEAVAAANTIEQAAVVLTRQRDEAQKKLAASENALREVERRLGVEANADRENRIDTLVAYEKAVQRLGGVALLEEKLVEQKAIEDIIGGLAPHGAVAYVRECVALVKGFSRPFWSRATDPVSAHVALDEVAEKAHRVYATHVQKGASEEGALVELAAIEHAFQKLQEQGAAHRKLSDDVAAARSVIAAEWPGIAAEDLSATMRQIASRMHAAEEILPRVREYLSLPDDDPNAVRALLGAEMGKPNRVLRLVLAAACPEVNKQLTALADDSNASVLRMLCLYEVGAQLEIFLHRLSGYTGNGLWETGISTGFSQSWLHHLFRAEAVLRTYFMDTSLAELGDLLTLVVWAFRHAITAAGIDVDRVHLLAAPPVAMEPKHGTLPEFRSCPDIRSRVQTVLKTQRDGGFVVDVDSVGIRNGNQVLLRGAVVLASRIDWED